MKVHDSNVQHIEVSKELEIINFKVLRENLLGDEVKEGSTKHWILEERKTRDDNGKNKVKDQFTSFQKAMKVLIIWGQCSGLNPVTGILQNDVSKMRLSVCSLKFLFTITMCIAQTIGTVLSFYRLITQPIQIQALGFLTFFTTTCCTTFAFIWIASKWPMIMKELSNSRLDEYIDPGIIRRCNLTCVAFIAVAVVEHVLSVVSRAARVHDCAVNATDYVEEFIKASSPWFYKMNVPYIPVIAIIVQYITIVTTITWNYSDIFVVCMSLYLTSILKQINKRITLAANKNYMPTSIWGVLREDYTRATRLVRLFDKMFSSIILITFASDLFFICLQLYNIFAKFTKQLNFSKNCAGYSSSILQGYEYPIYITYSTLYIFTRFLTVSLVAAGVNTAAMEPATILYRLPTSAYTQEVERFLNQVNGNVVALSGLQFFYVTRELVLSVAGTIVTYELVLLQFSNDELAKN